jgi:CBS domain-containing protein
MGRAFSAPIACRDHLLWIKERLGEKAFAHPNLLLATQRLLTDVDPSQPKSRLRREDQIKDSCAKCRQKVVSLDEFSDMPSRDVLKEKEVTDTVRHILLAKGHEVWSVTPETTVYDALKLMAEKGVGALPVVDASGIVGIVSERDYSRKVALKGRSSLDTPVREIMVSPVYFVHPDTTADECMALMTEKRIRHLPVMDEKKLVGIVSIGDVVKFLIDHQQVTIERLQNYIMGKIS